MDDLERRLVNDIQPELSEGFGKIDFFAKEETRKVEIAAGTEILPGKKSGKNRAEHR